jgi:endo-1,4-beta-D-glucanase Y
MHVRRTLLVALLLLTSAAAATKYPFPQAGYAYRYGIAASNANFQEIQSVYSSWKSSFYEESGDLARIKWDSPSKTVSEGIGYGMLIMVFMDNETNKTQPCFDKLWNYYKKFRKGNGVMNWKINGFSGVAGDGQNGATDAELDAAAALLMANKQWGADSYLQDAKTLIKDIFDHEVNGNRYLKPGDAWDSKKNPSYFSTGVLQIFKQVDQNDWQTVINNSYALLKKVQNGSSGLVPDWCSEDGNPLADFSYDAVRTPWRMAWAYAWQGHADSRAINEKMANWIIGKTGGDFGAVRSGYKLDGSSALQNFGDAAFVGAFACAGMVSPTYRDWVDKGYAATKTASATSYYTKTLQMLFLLLISGNMPNFYDMYTDIRPARPVVMDSRVESPAAVVTINKTLPAAFVSWYDLRGRRFPCGKGVASGMVFPSCEGMSGLPGRDY